MEYLKIKAWDTLNKKWLDVFKLVLAVDGSVISVVALDGEVYGVHQVMLCLYTGLTDKKGKEIFEGDIVTFNPSGKPLAERPFEVVYGGTYDYAGFGITAPREQGHVGTDPSWDFLNARCAAECEVVGNIYEHTIPEVKPWANS